MFTKKKNLEAMKIKTKQPDYSRSPPQAHPSQGTDLRIFKILTSCSGSATAPA